MYKTKILEYYAVIVKSIRVHVLVHIKEYKKHNYIKFEITKEKTKKKKLYNIKIFTQK